MILYGENQDINMKIIGYSDVITNSSSETFIWYTREGINQIKDIVNSILKLGGSNKTFDDYFTINLDVDLEEVKEKCKIPEEEFEKMSIEEIENIAMYNQSGNPEWDYYDNTIPTIDGVCIRAKDSNNKDIARLLMNIDNIFDKETYFNG